MPFAWDEFKSLVQSELDPSKSPAEKEGLLRYIVCLVSELCYYHPPKIEVGDKKRAKVVPCSAYQQIVSSGLPINIKDVEAIILPGETDTIFIAETRGIISVGLKIDKDLFIGFRGTAFLYDWKVNLRSSLVSLEMGPVLYATTAHNHARILGYRPVRYRVNSGLYHKGFLEEAIQICAIIKDLLKNSSDIKRVFLCGHSLGGAVAVLSQELLWDIGDSTDTIVFGSPRYGNISAVYNQSSKSPVEIRRYGDLVPSIPPSFLGYADGPRAFSPDGIPFSSEAFRSKLNFPKWNFGLVSGRAFEAHSIEGYRAEIGNANGIKGANRRLIDIDLLRG